MSTPSGKPFDPIRISDYAPKIVRDRLAARAERKIEPQPDRPSGPLNEPHEAPLETKPDEKFDERHPTPLAPVGPHERSRGERNAPREEGGADERRHPREPAERAHQESGYPDAHAGSEDASSAEDGYSDEDASSQEEADSDERAHLEARAQRAFAAHGAAYEVDLQRLEADLEALRGGGRADAGRLPPAGQLPPVRELRRARDTYIDGIRLPRSLEPSYLPPPPMQERSSHLGAVQRIFIACALAAPLTYFLVSYFSAVNEPAAKRESRMATVETQVASLPPMQDQQPSDAAPVPQRQAALAPVQPPARPATSEPPPQSAPPPQPALQQPALQQPAAPFTLQSASPAWPQARETIASAPPASQPARANPAPALRSPPPAPAHRPVAVMNAEEVGVLLKQGEQFISTGDVVTARLVFERVAEAGNASGALALGATYDPAVLAKLGVRGIAPDVAKARQWYERARDLGSAEAVGRLERLAQR